LARRLSTYRRFAVAGYRPGFAGLPLLLRHHRQAVEAELKRLAGSRLTAEVEAPHEDAGLPPLLRFVRLCADGSAEFELQSFRRPGVAQPGGEYAEAAGAAGVAVQPPQPGGRHFTELLPDVVSALPQLRELRLGREHHAAAGLQRPRPAAALPVVHGGGRVPAGAGAAAPSPAAPAPVQPAAPEPAAPAGGAL